MFYEPFNRTEQVESFFGHSVNWEGKEMTIVGSSLDPSSKVLYIQAVDGKGEEVSMPATAWFHSAKYKGYHFGKPIEGEDDEN